MPELIRDRLNGHPKIPSTATGMGSGCLILFSLPFVGIGSLVLAISLGMVDITIRNSSNSPAWLLPVFGSVFLVAGLMVAYMGVMGVVRTRDAEKRRHQYPTEPWYWDHRWNSKRAESGGIGGAMKTFGIALFMGLFLSMFNWILIGKGAPIWVKLFIGLFDFFALLVLAGGFYQLFQYFKYGKSRLHFSRFPFRLGSSIEAGLEASGKLASAPVLSITVRYIEEVMETHGTGKNRSTTQVLYALHEIQANLTPSQFDQNSGMGIPILIRLPDEKTWTNNLLGSPRRYWDMHIKAETPGIDYEAHFLLPVY